ncbi:putative rna recognition motif containing protein [Diplodia seriata]|uniref:Putative rna recognition motif containing protein n=1 Tax=Diplodia seriata TaxID=420778 RepID=A0A0G2EYS6_9PEZI|nr:putative rna recognition motif containing protein [Diplodia seriata]
MPEPFEPEHAPLETGTTSDHDLEYTSEPNARHKPSDGSLAEKRSLNITDLSPTTSLNEIVGSIKGGMLVEIFRINDRVARVSFRHCADAQAFCNYARRNDIYINNKRVTVDWADRQWRLNAYVHGMMTRKPYKFLKIDFERDECDEPLPQPVRPSFFDSVKPASQQTVKSKASVNLYGVLDLDPEEDEEDDSGPWQSGRRDSGLTDGSSICEPRRSDSDPMHYA